MRIYQQIILALVLSFSFTACERDDVEDSSSFPTDIEDFSNDVQEIDEPLEVVEKRIYLPSPELPAAEETIRIAIISDINSSYGSTSYIPNVLAGVKDIVARKPHLVISPGDVIAGQAPGLDYAAMWRSFHFQVGDVFFDHNIEFILAPGNHDASGYPAFVDEREAYAEAWKDRKPRAQLLPGSRFPFYYAVRTHRLLIVALDHNVPHQIDDAQLDWLALTLAQNRDARASIVLAHLPLEPIHWPQFSEISGSARLEKILKDNGVTFYISGHHHLFYPGHLGELRTLAAPALGVNPRNSYGQTPSNAYIWMEIPPYSPAHFQALVAPDFKTPIDFKTLPTRLMRAEREDLGMAQYIMEMLDHKVRPQTP